MKKLLITIVVLLSITLACTYIFIPNKITISGKEHIAANQRALLRTLGESENWKKWWPAEKLNDTTVSGLQLNGLTYKITDIRFSSLPVSISDGKNTNLAELTFISINPDSTDLAVSGIIPTSYNPIKRIQAFFRAQKIKKDIKNILESINSYYSKSENLYGFAIQRTSVVDSTLISTYKEINDEPTTEIVYSLVDELKDYIKKQGAVEKGYPMMNLYTKDGITYLVRVAIPVDKQLPASGNISYKWMLGGGNILITDVRGGHAEIKKAYDQTELYVADHNRVAPAIPFQSMITDRRQEKDSTKWITKIYYPVM